MALSPGSGLCLRGPGAVSKMAVRWLLVLMAAVCAVSAGSARKPISEYVTVCARAPASADACVLAAVEQLRPRLAAGIPELDVPAIEPFYIPEIVVDTGNLLQFKAVGHDIKVTGASNFKIKSLHLDLDTFTIRARIHFPELHLDGKYDLDGRLLVLPLAGRGNIKADAISCDAELLMHSTFYDKEGEEYLRFSRAAVDITVRDYRIKLDGLFNGERSLSEAANQLVNQNKAEFLRHSKPYIERTVSRLLLDIANKIASKYPIDEILPPVD